MPHAARWSLILELAALNGRRRRRGQREQEFAVFALLAVHPDLAAGQIDEDFADMQTQAASGGVQPTAFVFLVKAVEHIRQRLGRNTRACVAHAYGNGALALCDGKTDLPAHIAELDSVVHQIVDDLVHQILIRQNQGLGWGEAADLDVVGLQPLFRAEHHAGDALPDIIGSGVYFILPGLQLGDVQHVLDETRQAAHLLRDNAQVVVLVFGRDGAVQHAVDKALDGGHGRAQLVSDIAHEAAAGLVDFFQAAGHGVKGLGQLGQLIVALHGHAGGKISAAELFRGVRNAAQRRGHAVGQHDGKHAGYHQHQPGGEDERREQVCQVFREAVGVCPREHKALEHAFLVENGLARDIISAAEDTAQSAHFVVNAPAVCGIARFYRHFHALIFRRDGKHHGAVGVRHKDALSGGAGRQRDAPFDILHIQPGGFGGFGPFFNDAVIRGFLHGEDGVVDGLDQGGAVFFAEVAHGQIHLNKAHHGDAADEQDCRGIKIPRGDAFAHGRTPLSSGMPRTPARRHSFTSNL